VPLVKIIQALSHFQGGPSIQALIGSSDHAAGLSSSEYLIDVGRRLEYSYKPATISATAI
jgi:hypothetical protein